MKLQPSFSRAGNLTSLQSRGQLEGRYAGFQVLSRMAISQGARTKGEALRGLGWLKVLSSSVPSPITQLSPAEGNQTQSILAKQVSDLVAVAEKTPQPAKQSRLLASMLLVVEGSYWVKVKLPQEIRLVKRLSQASKLQVQNNLTSSWIRIIQ